MPGDGDGLPVLVTWPYVGAVRPSNVYGEGWNLHG